ncbi:hypothetical protein GCM10010145_56270 [Streptomyces ruber]|uniref:Uncharacterized protein n=2 Tax=Streptomyces TaxID=1883 RepID=A0A918BPV0_9ACTN|nr:hypothetical protein GCM10010145_56270 [Streptomyces ruber]
MTLPSAVRHRAPLRRGPARLAGFGLPAVAGVRACCCAAISRVPVGVALLVRYLGPALLLGWVRSVQRRPVTRAAAVGDVLAVGGLACVVEVWSGPGFDVVGLLPGRLLGPVRPDADVAANAGVAGAFRVRGARCEVRGRVGRWRRGRGDASA